MDDDVKNLFQKFGQPTEAYREINREADSESARKRWPLLRDVHLHSENAQAHAHQDGEDTPVTFPHRHEAGFRPASRGTVANKAAVVKTTPVSSAVVNHASDKPSTHTPLKQLLTRHTAPEEPEQEQVSESAPTTGFLSKIVASGQNESAPSQRETTGGGLFASLGKAATAGEPRKSPAQIESGHLLSPPPLKGGRQAATATTFSHDQAQHHAVPAKQIAEHAPDVPARTLVGTPASKDKPLSAVLGRLAAKDDVKPVEAGVNSFFKKIFKP